MEYFEFIKRDPNFVFRLSLNNESSFRNPLKNPLFIHYTVHIKPFDHTKFLSDLEYLQKAYNDYLGYLYAESLEYCRPKFPPEINPEDYVKNYEDNKIDVSRANGGNSYIVYRRYLIQYLATIGEDNTDMKKISPLSSILWNSEPPHVKECYKKISSQIKKINNDRFRNIVNGINGNGSNGTTNGTM